MILTLISNLSAYIDHIKIIPAMVRMFYFTYPLINQGSGRIKTDSINEQRVQTVFDNFESWCNQHGCSSKLSYLVTKNQMQLAQILMPLTGFCFGVICSAMFVHPNSKYIGKIFTVLTTGLFYTIYRDYQRAYLHSRYFTNYQLYPLEIRRMIENNDARYAHRWLRQDFLTIKLDKDTLK